MGRVVTAAVVNRLPSMQGLDAAARRAIVADAERVFARVQAQPWVDETELRAWGEANSLPPDRLNASLALLRDTGRVVLFGTPTPAVTDDLDAKTVPELQTIAAGLNIDGRSSMTKPELIAAIRAARALQESPPPT